MRIFLPRVSRQLLVHGVEESRKPQRPEKVDRLLIVPRWDLQQKIARVPHAASVESRGVYRAQLVPTKSLLERSNDGMSGIRTVMLTREGLEGSD